MALFRCSTCGRNFGEEGFCPHDGIKLAPVVVTNAPTFLDPAEFGPVGAPPPRAKFAPANVVTEVDPNPQGASGAPGLPDVGGVTRAGPGAAAAEASATAATIAPAVFAEQIAKAAQAAHARGRVSSGPAGAGGPAGGPAGAANPAGGFPPAVHSSAQPVAQILVSRAGGGALTPHAPFAEYDALVGATLDERYRLTHKIGEGAMGVVFAAKHRVIERPLAVKILRKGYARDPKVVERFLREAKAASRIGHPNIVEVTDFGRTADGMAYAVMEFLQGEPLNHAIAKGAFGISRAIKIAAQIARALAAAHDKGVIHRDLKSENIMLVEREGRADFVKVMDFGVAKLTSVGDEDAAAEPRLTLAGSIMGTPEYMAPEQAAGKNDADHRVDVYSLGIVLYEMIAGRLPFRGETLMRTLAMQIFDPLPPLASVRPGVPVELVAVIERACDKEPSRRFANMGDVAAALERIGAAALAADGAAESRSMRLPVGMRVGPVPGGLPAPDAVAAAAASVSAPSLSAAPRASEPRLLPAEPAFVARKKPVTIDSLLSTQGHPYDADDMDGFGVPRRRGRWGVWLALFVVSLGLGAAGWWLWRHRVQEATTEGVNGSVAAPGGQSGSAVQPGSAVQSGSAVQPSQPGGANATPSAPASATAPGASAAGSGNGRLPGGLAAVPITKGSAGKSGANPPNSAVTNPGAVASIPPLDPAPAARDPRKTGTKISIRVYTNPDGGNVYLDRAYRGPSGVTIQLPYGTRGTLTCQMFGYAEGAVPIVFDGTRESIACPMIRLGGCVEDIKNPYDKCP